MPLAGRADGRDRAKTVTALAARGSEVTYRRAGYTAAHSGRCGSLPPLTKDKNYHRRHPLRAVWWLMRYARPKTFARRWEELRTGSIRVSG
jgi:hypothetical protein